MSNSLISISLRPQKLDDVIGHSEVKATLTKQISEGRVPTAILFTGPPGVGKTTLALIVARLIQGPDYPTDAPIDVEEINGGERGKVDNARELAANAQYRPMVGARKVLIINEAQRMTKEAQECLLAPCESKDGTTTWIFTSMEPAKIESALAMRCLRFDLKPLSKEGIEILVTRACDALSRKWTAADDEFVAYMALCKVNSPRAILMSYEKYVGGVNLKDTVSESSHEPLYAEVAKAVLRGDWNATRGMLEQIKTPDVRGLRAVVTAFLGNALVRSEPGPKADALATCLMGMGVAYEDGLAYAQTKGALYKVCRQISGGK